ncbi:MAG: BspA family leucine-rich repeat surface protein [Candidatus Gracilibacteria bacterium]|nr:BspA family leucine-rich repeat surface protein [Candidatus Gracilibacteria bacterium]
MKLQKRAFTLVELIVVITILAILATVAFISFQGYAQTARDSKRLTDMKSMEKVLGLYFVTQGNYPLPVGAQNVTFSGATAWSQGAFGTTAYTNQTSLGEVPVDPLTKMPYAYSITNTKVEYQLGGILEGDVALTPTLSTFAGTEIAKAYVKGNYNGKILKVTADSTDYILGVPSILASDLSDTNLLNIVNNQRLVHKSHKNLPDSFSGTIYNPSPTDGFAFTPTDIVVFSGSLETLSDPVNITQREELLSNLKEVYVGSPIVNDPEIYDVTHVLLSDSSSVEFLSSKLLNETVNMELPIPQNVVVMYDPVLNTPAPIEETAPIIGVNSFVTTWDVGIDTGLSGYNSLQFPLINGGNYDFTIQWGDGTSDTINSWDQAESLHTYTSSGVYTVVIDGVMDSFGFSGFDRDSDNAHDGDKLIDVAQWGDAKLINWGNQFNQCKNLVGFSATDTLDLSSTTNMIGTFYKSEKFTGAGIENWDVSSVTHMNEMFERATDFNGDVSSWNVSNVMFMPNLFAHTSFNQDISPWYDKLEKLQNITGMFSYTPFNQDISSWDVSNVTNLSFLFRNASNFNQPLNGWNISSAIRTDYMFANAPYFNQPLNGWNVSNVTNMSGMFQNADSFNQDLSAWGTKLSKVTNMSQMFAETRDFDGNVSNWQMPLVTNMHRMFKSTKSFNQPLNGWNVSGVENFSLMFYEAEVFDQPLDNWIPSSATNISSMFAYTDAFNQPLNSWGDDLGSVTNMKSIFAHTDTFDQPLNAWVFPQVDNFNSLFRNAVAFNQDISGWNVSNITNMTYMFEGASSFDQNISNWSTHTNTNVGYCNYFSNGTTSSWEVSEKPSFSNCTPGY